MPMTSLNDHLFNFESDFVGKVFRNLLGVRKIACERRVRRRKRSLFKILLELCKVLIGVRYCVFV